MPIDRCGESLYQRARLGLINTFTLKLVQVFVDLRIAPSGNPQRPGMDRIAVKELTGNRPIPEFLRVKRGKNEAPAALAVVGPPSCSTGWMNGKAFGLFGIRPKRRPKYDRRRN